MQSLMLALGLSFCATAQSCTLTIAAASDLAPLRALMAKQLREVISCDAVFTFASSGQLAVQIENGAPFDVYLSANEMFVERLIKANIVDAGTKAVFARGRLGLWPPASTTAIALTDLTRLSYKRIAIANPAVAPYGLAAKQALESAGIYEAVKSKLIFGENVRQTMQFADSGNVDAVITSWSLLRGKPGAIRIDEKLHRPILQTLGIILSTKQQAKAREFARWLTSSEGKKLLASAGFD